MFLPHVFPVLVNLIHSEGPLWLVETKGRPGPEVACCSVAAGMGEASILAMTSFYDAQADGFFPWVFPSHDGSMVLVYMRSHKGGILMVYVTIYIAYMDPMGMVSHGFPMVFPWFSKFSDGFPMVFRGFSEGFPRVQCLLMILNDVTWD